MIIEMKIDVPFLDDNGKLDDLIKTEVVDRIVASIKDALNPVIRKEAVSRIHKLTDRWIMEQIEVFCDRQVNITDKWGDVTETHQSVNDLLKVKFDDYLNGAVDKDGNALKGCPTGTKNTRFEFVLEQKARQHTDKLFVEINRSLGRILPMALKEKQTELIKNKVVEELVEIERNKS